MLKQQQQQGTSVLPQCDLINRIIKTQRRNTLNIHEQ